MAWTTGTTSIITDAQSLVANTSGNVYVTDSSPITINGNSTGAIFSLTDSASSTGNITVSNTITATGALTLQAGANGSIALNANLSGTSVTLNANGTGVITQASGANISATGTLTLFSGTGDFGTTSAYIATNAPALVANTSGNVFLTDSAATTVSAASSSGGNFFLTDTATTTGSITVSSAINAAGNLTLQAGTNGTITVNANLTGDSVTLNAAGTGTIAQGISANISTSGTLNLSSTSGTIGTSTAVISTNAPNVSANTSGNVYITDSNPVTISASSTGAIFSFTDSGSFGSITISNPITTTSTMTLQAGTAGAIAVNANLQGTSVTLSAPTGSISQASGTNINVTSGTLTLSAGEGTIGSSAANITTSAANLIANAANNVYISDSSPVTISGASSGILYNLTDIGNITVTAPITATGGISISTVTGGLNISGSLSSMGPITLIAPGAITVGTIPLYYWQDPPPPRIPSYIPAQLVTVIAGGAITLTGSINALGLDLVSSSSISVGGSGTVSITTSGGTALGLGSINAIAGALYTSNGAQINITGPSITGGQINLASATNIYTNGAGSNGASYGSIAGGDITLVAFAGSASGSGQVSLPTGITIQAGGTGGSTPAANGNVTIVAGATSPTAPSNSISLGGMSTATGSAGTGSITLSTSTPNITPSTPLIIDEYTGKTIAGSPLGGNVSDASISGGTTLSIATSGGLITITAGAGIIAGALSTVPAFSGAGGVITLISGAYSTNPSTLNVGAITTAGFSSGSVGGSVFVSSTGNITSGAISTGGGELQICSSANITVGAVTTGGGDVQMLAGSSTTAGNVSFGNINTTGSTSGGNVSIISVGSTGTISNSSATIITDANSGATAGEAGNVTISSPVGQILLSSISAQSASSTGPTFGGDVLLTTGYTGPNGINMYGSGNVINTSTASSVGTAGQIYIIQVASSSTNINPTGSNTAQSIGTTRLALPTIAQESRTALTTTTSISFVPGTGGAAGSITGYSAGGFSSISDATGELVLTINTSGDSRLSVPIISLAAFTLTNGATQLETMVSSGGVASQFSIFGTSNGVDISAALITSSSTSLPIAAVGSTSGTVSINETASGQSISVGSILSGAPLSINTNGTLSLNGNQSSASSLQLTGTSILQYFGNIITPALSLTATSGDVRSATCCSQPLQTNTTNLSVDAGGNTYVSNMGTLVVYASNSAGTLSLSANGGLIIDGSLSANLVSLSASTIDGNISVDANIVGASGVSISAAGDVINATSTSISTVNSPISITAFNVSFLGSINAGTSTVTLIPTPVSNEDSTIVGGTIAPAPNFALGYTDLFTVLDSDLAAITASTVIVNNSAGYSPNDADIFVVQGNIDVSGSGPSGAFNLVFNTGQFSLQGNITLGSKSLQISSPGGDYLNGTILSSSGSVSITGGGDLYGPIDIGGTLSVTGAFYIAANLTASSGITMVSTASGYGDVIGFQNPGYLNTLNAPISITAYSITLNSGSINAGSGTVTLLPNSSESISVGSTSGTFSVPNSLLSSITASTLIVGTTAQTGGITVAGNVNVSGTGAGAYNLQLNNGGNYTAAGQTITLGNQSLAVNVLGTVNTGSVSGGTGTVSIAGAGVTISGQVSTTGTVSITSTNSGAISQSGSSVVSAANVILASGTGGIGSSSSPILTATPGISVNTAGNVYVQNTGAVTINSSSAGNGASFQLVTTPDTNGNGSITVNGNIAAASGTIGSIVLQSSESGSGQGGIVWTAGTLIGQTISLQDGASGLGSGNIGTSTAPLLTATSNLSVNSAGNVYVQNVGALSLNASSAGNGSVFQLATTPDSNGNGSITVNGNVSSASGTIASILLQSSESGSGTGGISTTAGTLTAATVGLQDGLSGAGSGSIGSASTPLEIVTTTVSAMTSTTGSGSIYLQENGVGGTLTLLASSSGGAFSLATNRSLLVSGFITVGSDQTSSANNLTLVAAGSSLQVAANLTVTGGSIVIQNTNTSSGSISFSSAAQVTTMVDSPTTGTITVAIGSVPPAEQNPGQSNFPSSIVVTENGANVYAGATPGSIIGPTSGTANVTAQGQDVIFNSPNSTTLITLGAGVLIEADPPGVASQIAPPPVYSSPSAEIPQENFAHTNALPPITQYPQMPGLMPGGSINATDTVPTNRNSEDVRDQTSTKDRLESLETAAASTRPATSHSSEYEDIYAFDPENILMFDDSGIRQHATGPIRHELAPENMISDCIPIAFQSTTAESAFAIHGRQAVVNSDIPFMAQSARTADRHRGSGDGIIRTTEGRITFHSGSMLFAPDNDLIVNTDLASIELGAKSIVLVVASARSVAVYNMHDAHFGDVVVSVGSRKVILSPGQQVAYARGGIRNFSDLNPFERVGYRNLKAQGATTQVHEFSSDFSIISALNSLKLFANLQHSGNAKDARIMRTLVKNAAIRAQMGGTSGAYQRIPINRRFITAAK